MKISLRGGLTTLATAALLVVGFDYVTYAANGDSLILGQVNNESTGTTLSTSGAGPALTLKGNSGPALALNTSAKVTRLNADRVDSIEGADTQNPAYTFTVGTAGGTGEQIYTIPQLPAGNYLMTYTASFYPQGAPGTSYFFSCFSRNASLTALTSQSTGTSAYTAGFYVGVSASSLETVPASGMPSVACNGQNASGGNVPWTWGNTKLRVTFIKVNDLTSGNIAGSTAPAKGGRSRAGTP